MDKRLHSILFVICCLALMAGSVPVYGQEAFSVVTGKTFEGALPGQFYLEGNAIPTEKRNAALLTTPSGHRFLTALLDTSGYSSQVQTKYMGMMINEGPLMVCGKSLGVGSFGFGMKRPAESSSADATFFLYDQAGKEVSQCSVKKDSELKRPVPLQTVLKGEKTALLYFGRYFVEIKP
ncbi:MAG TPA: hypothetical protein VFM21_10120 [Terriglobia bacterium]|nr:hypothetical protein [Terriglobia bacterium]